MAKAKSKKSTLPKEINIHYIKTSSYRTYHVDGAYGGLTPKGDLYCEFFVERQVTPQSVVHEVENDGRLGKMKKKIGEDGFIRQIECGISLDINTATALKGWLEEKIHEYNNKSIKSIKRGKK